MTADLRIEKLRRDTPVEAFDCGSDALNSYLTRYAWQNQQGGAAQTYVARDGDAVVGYYTLVVGQVDYEDASERMTRGLSRHPVPIMLLARLAVSIDRQRQKLGGGLLKDAMLRTLQAAEIAGIRAFVVHAKDDAARAFYERYDFLPSPSDPFHLAVLLKDIKVMLS